MIQIDQRTVRFFLLSRYTSSRDDEMQSVGSGG